ncbi:transposase [Cupriavidus necator]|uniref:Transposase n=1 Tax=Cupriavidus necator TaxID=106590 RepID=A0A367PJS6_CUPNE|nr:transposase [Cupriavidus necator]QQX84123.1 transposase [Cupriavidus necator]RCJ08152.1 transposase [Cupriavidus necator]
MARLPRFSPAGLPALVLQRGNNRQPVFLGPDDYLHYLDCLRMAAREHDLAIHAYTLRPNHVHLVATPKGTDSLSLTMQAVGRRYARYFNRVASRTGTLWEGRFRSAVFDPARWMLPAMLYVEGNALRAGEVSTPEADRWSSYHHHAGIEASPFVSDHSAYWELGNTPFERQSNYRMLTAEGLSGKTLETLRGHAHSGWPLGDEAFLAQLERHATRRVQPLPKGRPKKVQATSTDVSDSTHN